MACRMLAALVVATVALSGGAAFADERQRCASQCLVIAGTATDPAYAACVAQNCDGGAPNTGATAAGVWTNHTNGGGYSAAIRDGARSLNYLCQPGGPAIIGLTGFGAAPDGIGLSIDGRGLPQRFIARDDALFTTADTGSPLLDALMSGSQVDAVSRRGTLARFPLTGSRAAITQAMAACRIGP